MPNQSNTISPISRTGIEQLKTTIKNLYKSDKIPWIIGYSGGKDSTATVQIVWMAIKELPEEERIKEIYVINTDTLVESPVVSKWVKNSLQSMETQAEKQKLPFKIKQLTPKKDQTFWVNLLGRGYPFPRKKYRWCTDRMKIRPVNDFVQSQIEKTGEVIMVLGTRKAESTRRAHVMNNYEKKRVRELLSPNPTMINELVFSPLEDWTNDDVWAFLMQYENPWCYPNSQLLTLYQGATADKECPMMIEKDLPSCGQSRFGCWVCTMVDRDKSMEAMITNDREKEWMLPLVEFRNKFGEEEKDRERRSFRKRNGTLQGGYLRLNHGPYKKEVREEWLQELLNLQEEIQQFGPEEFSDLELISIEELKEIRRIWVFENHEFDDTLPGIYEKSTGKKFPDPDWINPLPFAQEEWNLLKEIVREKYNDEELAVEMVSSLIDIQGQGNAHGTGRKEIRKMLEKEITKTFYKNENDATEYFLSKMKRRKELGQEVNEKILDDRYEEEDSE